ncbi:MAG: hypothetical protein HY898_06775 [Deltaproteobacteria bacterium]|nr:hypothetical protein [Deltaproteobacteria bacterium]
MIPANSAFHIGIRITLAAVALTVSSPAPACESAPCDPAVCAPGAVDCGDLVGSSLFGPSPWTTFRTRPFSDYQVRLVAEGGGLAVLSNRGEFGPGATRIDFRSAAGQDNLAFYTRWSAELELGRRHTVIFLYQPLSTEGVHTPSTDERYEGVTFAAGHPVRTEFAFPFYRLSYLNELFAGNAGYFSVGFTGQIRNADYRFTRLDGEAFSRTKSVGFVPALKVRGEVSLGRASFLGFEADGIYAPISVLNGSDNETVGAILDASVRAGVRVHPQADAFLNVRYLGGGATNTDPSNYAKNWLHFLFVGLGASFDLLPGRTRNHRLP